MKIRSPDTVLLFWLVWLVLSGCNQPLTPCGSNDECGDCEKCLDGRCVSDPEQLNACGFCNPTQQERVCHGDCCEPLEICHQQKCCLPDTCESMGKECGSFADGCGGQIDCKKCAQYQVCDAGVCVCQHLACDQVCCQEGAVCHQTSCCLPKTCAQLEKTCGSWSDGCGGQILCGQCLDNQICGEEGQCQCQWLECDEGCCQEDQVCRLHEASCGQLVAIQPTDLPTHVYTGFGLSLSLGERFAVVGASSQAGGADGSVDSAGAVYVFERFQNGQWSEGIQLMSPDPRVDDRFGISVSLYNDEMILIGASQDSSEIQGGQAFAFVSEVGADWSHSVMITSADTQPGDRFGWSVAMDGDFVIIGAVGKDNFTGAAYIFQRTDRDAFDSGTKIVAPDAQTGDNFGESVSISGDVVIVGAPGVIAPGSNPVLRSGAAYLYKRIGANTWSQGVKITSHNTQSEDLFGTAVSLSGNDALVGAPLDGGRGAAYIFQLDAHGSPDMGEKIEAFDGKSRDGFGYSVSIHAGYAVVGATDHIDSLLDDANDGAAYLFKRTASNTWVPGPKLWSTDTYPSSNFGRAVSIRGVRAIIGSLRNRPPWGASEGVVYFY